MMQKDDLTWMEYEFDGTWGMWKDYNNTDMQQQYLTNVEYQYREGRRRTERKRKAEKQAISNSGGITSVKHDDTKELQRQIGLDLLEQEKMYHPAIIKEYEPHVKEKAHVRNTSKKGTTSTDKILKKERVQKAEERKARSRKNFPSIEELRQNASDTQVDNDKTWKYIDEATAKKQDFIDTVMKVTFWRNMPAKNVFKEQVKKVFPILWKDEYSDKKVKKQKLLYDVLVPYLKNMIDMN